MRFSAPWLPCAPGWALLALPLLVGCGGGAGDDGSPGADAGVSEEPAVPLAEIGTYLHMVVPSVVEVGEDLAVKLRVVTQVGLPDYDFDNDNPFRIEGRGNVKFPEPLRLEPKEDGFVVGEGIRFESPGVQFLRCSVPGDTVRTVANPINVVREAGNRIYWGDLNGHSDLSSGNRPPAVFFWYAKGVALLDFVALTDNDAWEGQTLENGRFAEIVETTLSDLEEPGKFVGIPAFEWTSAEYGNRLVYFSDPPAALPTPAAGYDTPAKLRDALSPDAVVAISHPSGSTENYAVDPATVGFEDLVEIYSMVGIFESPATHRASTQEKPGAAVVDLLAAGWRPGFVANGDSRLTTPGNPRPIGHGDLPYPGGLTAVLAPELTREAVLEALRERRCYATTGQRYLLEFTVDGHQMGSELRVPAGHQADVYGSLGSTTNWVRLEIMGPKGAVAVLTPEPGQSDVVELAAKTDPIQEPTWLYVRGVDESGGMAWSSPVFLLPE